MKNFVAFLCIMALLTGSLAGCNTDKNAKATPTPVSTATPTVNPDPVPDTDDGIVTDDDGIIEPKESAKP